MDGGAGEGGRGDSLLVMRSLFSVKHFNMSVSAYADDLRRLTCSLKAEKGSFKGANCGNISVFSFI